MVHFAKAKGPAKPVKPVQESRQQALRAYCSNVYTVDLNVGSQDGYRLYTLMNPILCTLLLWRFKFPYSKIKGLKFFRLRVYKLELVVTFINLDCSQRFFFTSHIQNIVVRCSAKFFEQFPEYGFL